MRKYIPSRDTMYQFDRNWRFLKNIWLL